MKRFKLAGQAQRFLSAHDGINNLFHLRRGQHEVPAIIGQEHRVVGRHVDAVGPRVLAFTQERRKFPSWSNTIIGCSPRLSPNAGDGARPRAT